MCLCRVQRFVRRILGMLVTSVPAQRCAGGSSKCPGGTPTLAALAAGLDQHVQAACKRVDPTNSAGCPFEAASPTGCCLKLKVEQHTA